jgi:muramoyltetrapeptide carboxypeptidase LdcA involved in peptidoglycan recycling
MKLIKPPALHTGDRVAIVSPSWGGPSVFSARYEAGKKRLEEIFGLQVVEMPHTRGPAQFLFDHPKARADDLMQAFADPSIKGIFASIGGEDSIRLLPYLDFDLMRKNPKVFMGYSDTTILHFACLKAGLSSFYGPSVMVEFAENVAMLPYVVESLRKTVFSADEVGEVPQAEQWTDEFLDWANPENQNRKRSLRPAQGWQVMQGEGKLVSGPLIGGCIDVFGMAAGTALWPAPDLWRGALVFLETSEEAPAVPMFKRWLRNMGAMGIFDQAAAILLGRPCNVPAEEISRYDTALMAVVAGEFGKREIPIMTQMDFGHTSPIFTIPYGARAEVDTARKILKILEPGVV